MKLFLLSITILTTKDGDHKDFTACQAKCEAIDTRPWGVLDEPFLSYSYAARQAKDHTELRVTAPFSEAVGSILRHAFFWPTI